MSGEERARGLVESGQWDNGASRLAAALQWVEEHAAEVKAHSPEPMGGASEGWSGVAHTSRVLHFHPEVSEGRRGTRQGCAYMGKSEGCVRTATGDAKGIPPRSGTGRVGVEASDPKAVARGPSRGAAHDASGGVQAVHWIFGDEGASAKEQGWQHRR